MFLYEYAKLTYTGFRLLLVLPHGPCHFGNVPFGNWVVYFAHPKNHILLLGTLLKYVAIQEP